MRKNIKKLAPPFIKNKVKKVLKKLEFKKFKKEATALTKLDLIVGLKKSGIKKGDILFIHSSLKGLGYIENGAQTVIEALKKVVGNEGTLLFPVFTIDMSMESTLSNSKHIFDPKTSLSTVGSISNTFLKEKDTVRSLHPTHSVAAWGKHANEIVEGHQFAKTNFGEGSPFGKFLELNGKLMGLGINYANVTFYHTFEDLNLELFPEVYLPQKINTKIKDHNNSEIEVSILCHNLKFHETRIEKDPKIEAFFANYFEKNNISYKTKIGQGEIWWMRSKEVIESLDALYKKNITIYNIN